MTGSRGDAPHGVPPQVLTDNARVFTGRFNPPPVEVLFDRICRENGIEHLLTKPRSPTTTGKIERFHRSLRAEFDTRRVFTSAAGAQALDDWVGYYNTDRPHQGLGMDTPADTIHGQPDTRSSVGGPARRPGQWPSPRAPRPQTGDDWVARRVGPNGIVCVLAADQRRQTPRRPRCDVQVSDQLLQFWIGDELLKTVTRTSTGEVRKKHAGTRQT